MAKIPDFTALGGTSIPQPRMSPPQIGEGATAVSRAMVGSGEQVARAGEIIDETNKKWDSIAAEDALNKLQNMGSDLELNPNDGFKMQLGGNAVGKKFYDNYMQRFQNSQNEIEGSLSNDRQKVMFQQRAQIAASQFRSSLLAHQARQTEVYADQTYDNTVKTELSNIAANPTNDIVAATSRARINAATSDYAQRHGLPVDSEMLKNNDAIWSARILSLMGTQPLQAQDMYDSHKSELSADTQITLDKQLKSAVEPVEAKNIADKIIQPTGKAKDVKASIGDWMTQASDEADKLHPNDPVFKDMVIQNVRSHANIIAANYEAQIKQAKDSLLTRASGLDGKPKAFSLDALLDTPEHRSQWMMLDPESQRGLLAVIDHNAKPIKSDAGVVSELFRRIHLPDDNPHKITTAGQLFPYFAHGLSREDYDWLGKQVDEMQTPGGQRLGDMRSKFFSGIKPTFDKGTLLNIDAQGAERFYQFQHYATDMEEQYRKAGKDPYTLYDPTSPDYLGKKTGQFQASLDEQMRNLSTTITGNQSQPAQATPNTGVIQRVPKEGETGTSKSGKPIIFRNGKWEYQ